MKEKLENKTEKEKFLNFFENIMYFEDAFETYGEISFVRDRIVLKMCEDSNWGNICFHVFIESMGLCYLTSVTKVKQLKRLLSVLDYEKLRK